MADASYTVRTRVIDAAGNPGTQDSQVVRIDTSAPDGDTTTLVIDDVTADNILNAPEWAGDVTVTGQVTGQFRDGDRITLTVNGNPFATTVNAQGEFSVDVTGTDLRDDVNRTIDAVLVASDLAGNTGNISGTKTYAVNQSPVDGDESLSATEGVAFTEVDLLANASDAEGDAMTLTVNSITGDFASLVTVTNGQLSINTAHSSLERLAAGATSTVEVRYTVSDDRGGSNTSTATVTFTGTNDAPTVSTTTISNNASLYSTAGSTVLSITDIDASTASGGVRENRVPTGWQALPNRTPDLNDYDNNAWKNVQGFPEFYVQSQVDGRSTDGGQFVGLVYQSSGNASEGFFTTMSGLTSGTVYSVAVQWQQAVLATPSDTPQSVTESYNGGQLLISTTGQGNLSRSYTSTGLNDGWQTAIYTFTASGTSQDITLQIDGANGISDSTARSKGGYIVVDSLVSSAFETQTYIRSSGITMSTLFPASNTADVDDNSSVRGYAITSAANGTTGGWEYSTDGGTVWRSLSAASVTEAFYLAGTDQVRYTGLRGSNTKLDVVVVDNTGPALHAQDAAATTINVTARGGTTAFSADVVTLSANAAPVLLDLDGDGRISYSVIEGDINVDGLVDQANWVASNDGILFHDKFGDGQLHSMDQFAFAQYGGNTDLEGLAIGFDTNKDGVFDARDAAFDAFQVWQDLNQDGKVDGGELNSLLSLGITSIALKSDGAERSPVAGVTEHGQTQATLANGGSMLVVDASLDYQHGVDLQAQADRLKAASVI
jgi:VCBS repeat-containing protein